MSVAAATPTSSAQTASEEYKAEQVTPRSIRLSAARAFALPLCFTLGFLGFALLGSIRQNPRLWWSIVGPGIVLLAWNAVLLAAALRTGRTLTLDIVLRKQHYLQACAQGAVLLYWGWHWSRVYDSASLIVAQLLLAYAFDMLLSWSRRDECTLGFAPFPIIFSINLFLWFKDDWFYLQCVMVALGLTAKEMLRWTRDGRRTHIFNPSSFPLAIFSVALIISGTSGMTWGREIAVTQFFPPHIYLMLFLISLPGQYLFGVTSMTMSAVVATYVFGLLYFLGTGTYFFFDSYIPIAVFLGMHLLFTDPSTAPRTELGRIMFGVAYGLSTVLLYQLLSDAGLPTFYDKLLQVPILNLSIKAMDRAARSKLLRGFDPAALGRSMAARRRNLAYIGIWAGVFAVMTAAQGVGDDHRGQWVPFWRHACDEERPYACSYLATVEATLCRAGSGWACNEFAILQTELQIDDGPGAMASLQDGCELDFLAACANQELVKNGVSRLASAPPTLEDYPIVLRGSKGPITDRTPASLYARACDQGWPDTCGHAE